MKGDLIWIGTLASLIAGLGTVAGAFFVFFIRSLSDTLEDAPHALGGVVEDADDMEAVLEEAVILGEGGADLARADDDDAPVAPHAEDVP